MPKLEFNRIIQIALAIVTLAAVVGFGTMLFDWSRTKRLTLAAGNSTGESYILGTAIKKVVERRNPRIRITVLETGGTAESLKMLEAGKVQLAAAQADMPAGPSARAIAILFDDAFQILVARDSPIRTFADLRGRRIALPQTGGQFQSFLRVADHFGLRESDFQFAGSTDVDADQIFSNGNADAVFRVRTLGDPSIERLVHSDQVRFLAIEHGAAMRIDQPSFQPAVIPQGAYLGDPPIPARDLPTIFIHRLLLAHAAADKSAIAAVTEALIEHRQEVMDEVPPTMRDVGLLLAQTRRPDAQSSVGPPLHEGARTFYDKDKPSFLQAHADYVGLLLTTCLMFGSWIWQLKRWMQRRQKHAADWYSDRAVALMRSAQGAESLAYLDDVWNALLAILTEAVQDLDKDELSEESFASFRSILQLALEVTKERRATLLSRTISSVAGFQRRSGNDVATIRSQARLSGPGWALE